MHLRSFAIAIAICALAVSSVVDAETAGRLSTSQSSTDDELGMARELGPATWARCAPYLANPDARSYELSYVRSNTMPLSPFGGPLERTYQPSAGLPGTIQIYNMDVLNENANPGQHGTQIDALGHFGYIDEAWDGTSDLTTGGAHYYGGLTQEQVKPTPDSPLLKLGMEKVPPIITTAILLDAKTHVGGGKAMNAGEVVTPRHIEEMLEAQGLSARGILPGDVVYIYTGWSDHYQDPDVDKVYYGLAFPGISYEAAKYLGERRVVGVGTDTPAVDALAPGQMSGEGEPPPGTPPEMVLPVHHYLLTEAGIHNLENIKLDELARDGVATSCTIILPARIQGAAGAAIRPVAIGVPGR